MWLFVKKYWIQAIHCIFICGELIMWPCKSQLAKHKCEKVFPWNFIDISVFDCVWKTTSCKHKLHLMQTLQWSALSLKSKAPVQHLDLRKKVRWSVAADPEVGASVSTFPSKSSSNTGPLMTFTPFSRWEYLGRSTSWTRVQTPEATHQAQFK